jgi:hypothetical protein
VAAKSPDRRNIRTSAHGTQVPVSASASSYSYEEYDDRQSSRQSNAHRHENQPKAEGPYVSKNVAMYASDSDVQKLRLDLDAAYNRIRDLEDQLDKLSLSSSLKTTENFELRFARMEAKIAENAQVAATSREALSRRITEIQATNVRIESRSQDLDSQITKIVRGNEEMMKKFQKRKVELEESIETVEALERRLNRQKALIENVLEDVHERAADLPPVLSFADAKLKKAVEEELHKEVVDDNRNRRYLGRPKDDSV